MGLFKVTIGVMGSSKSSRAIADVKNLRYQGQRVLVIKPRIDDRDGDKISSRLINETIQADMVIGPDDSINKKSIIENNYDCIVVDELHMLSVNHIEDLYEVSAISETEVHLYGLAMSWKGKPFMTTAMALAYADKIDKIEATDKQKNLLTHHIKKVGNMPCDITQEGGEIDTGDLGEEKYFTVSKQTFYNLYGMLDQLNSKKKKSNKFTTSGTCYPMVGQVVRLTQQALEDLELPETTVGNGIGIIVGISNGKYDITFGQSLLKGLMIHSFYIMIENEYYIPDVDNIRAHDSLGRYI